MQRWVFFKWRYFKFSKSVVESCRSAIIHYNVRSLRLISLAAALLLTIFSFFPLLIEQELHKFFIYLAAAVFELGVYGYTRWIYAKRRFNRGPVTAGFLLFFICIIAFGIYIGVISLPNSQAVNFMVFLIGIQIIFVLDPLWELVLNAAVVTVFSYLAIRIKPLGIWQTDVTNAVFAALGGMILSWHMSRVVIKEMRTAQRLKAERDRFEAASIQDELTGLGNRRDFLHRVDFYINACQRVRQTVCIIMMDVDHFKLYNDFYGHPQGDQVLKAIGGVLSRLMVEEKVFAARVGGEEFIVLWTENRLSEAQRLALKLRQMVIDLQIPHEKSPVAPYITASFGLYVLRGGSTDTAEELYERADKALYEAKNHGRNCVMLIDSADTPFRRVVREDDRPELE
jgi:diguanylate cyclase (GGDEF)-like protein